MSKNQLRTIDEREKVNKAGHFHVVKPMTLELPESMNASKRGLDYQYPLTTREKNNTLSVASIGIPAITPNPTAKTIMTSLDPLKLPIISSAVTPN